jgi:hypothetical protein
MILTSYLYVGVGYKKNDGVSSKLAPVSIVTLWIMTLRIQIVMTNCCWKEWTVANMAQGVQRVQFVLLLFTNMLCPITNIYT